MKKKARICKDSLFNKCCSENWTATYIRMKVDNSLYLMKKRNSRWIKKLKHVRHKTVKFQKRKHKHYAPWQQS